MLIGPGNAAALFPAIPPGSTTVIGAGNASGLFPEVTPFPTPSPASGAPPQAAEPSTSPAGRAAAIPARLTGTPVLTAQVLGLIALALAFLLTMTRLARRRRG